MIQNPFTLRDVPFRWRRRQLMRLGLLLCSGTSCGCGVRSIPQTVIRISGVHDGLCLTQALSETYHKITPYVDIWVAGGGDGIGFELLSRGMCDLVNSGRSMFEKEYLRVVKNSLRNPIGHIVGYDAISLNVHPDNPIESLSLEELAEIYSEDGSITRWSQLTSRPISFTDEIIPVARQSSSGVYIHFQRAVLGEREHRLHTIGAGSTKYVATLVSTTPSAIGYGCMGYQKDSFKTLAISLKPGDPAYLPTIENVRAGHYPIVRPLIMYSLGEPQEKSPLSRFLNWIYTPKSQALVATFGYIPVEKRENVCHAF